MVASGFMERRRRGLKWAANNGTPCVCVGTVPCCNRLVSPVDRTFVYQPTTVRSRARRGCGIKNTWNEDWDYTSHTEDFH